MIRFLFLFSILTFGSIGRSETCDQQLMENFAVTLNGHFNDMNIGEQSLENWVVGDTANYKFSMGWFSGTVQMVIREGAPEGFWVDQNIDAGFAGKQKAEALVDQKTGRVLRMIVNGKEQAMPEEKDLKVEETKTEVIAVPAGEFSSFYIRIRDTKKNETSEAWVNSNSVPVMGLIKGISPTDYGKMTLELTSFNKL